VHICVGCVVLEPDGMRQVWEDWKQWKLLELGMECHCNIRGAVTIVGKNRPLFIMGCLVSALYV
jgi:hypothetical protein